MWLLLVLFLFVKLENDQRGQPHAHHVTSQSYLQHLELLVPQGGHVFLIHKVILMVGHFVCAMLHGDLVECWSPAEIRVPGGLDGARDCVCLPDETYDKEYRCSYKQVETQPRRRRPLENERNRTVIHHCVEMSRPFVADGARMVPNVSSLRE